MWPSGGPPLGLGWHATAGLGKARQRQAQQWQSPRVGQQWQSPLLGQRWCHCWPCKNTRHCWASGGENLLCTPSQNYRQPRARNKPQIKWELGDFYPMVAKFQLLVFPNFSQQSIGHRQIWSTKFKKVAPGPRMLNLRLNPQYCCQSTACLNSEHLSLKGHKMLREPTYH